MTRSRRTIRILFGAVVALGAAGGMAGTALAGTALAGTALAGTTPAGTEPTGRILGENAVGSITGSYIVVLKDTAGAQADLAQRYGGAVRRTYTSAVKGFNVTMTAAAAKRLAASPAVAYVEQDRVVTADAVQTGATWGLDRIDQAALPLSTSYTYGSAAGVTAYVLDSGVRTTHAQFGGRARSGYDFIDNDADANDCNGHGTHVAGTVGGSTYGVAKDVKLVGVRVLDCNGSGSYSKIIAGVDWVTKNAVRPAVANMSLGGTTSTALDDAVKRSVASGVTYAVAAGNDNVDACTQSPARVPAAITVGATDSTDTRASFSNYGACLDIFAPGVKITAASTANDTASASMSGTSMASPHVAGAAALVLGANPSWSPAQVRDNLVGAATAGAVKTPGTGSVNKLLFTGAIKAAPAPQPTTPPTTAPTTPPTTAPTCAPVTFRALTLLRDLATTSAAVKVAGCTGAASATSKVTVDVDHTSRGDLAITLVAPDGDTFPLKAAAKSDTADDVTKTFTFDGSGAPRTGTWKLQVTDSYRGNIGLLKSFVLAL